MSRKHRAAAKARAARMPKNFFSKIAKKQHSDLTAEERTRRAKRLVRARRAKHQVNT